MLCYLPSPNLFQCRGRNLRVGDIEIMKIKPLHPWEVAPEEAASIQEKLRKKIRLKGKVDNLQRIAATDVAYSNDVAIAGVISFSYPELLVLEKNLVLFPVKFPYIPGLLSFREGPPIIEAFKKLKQKPDLLLFDGQGIAHPRRMGIATHLGIYLNIPSIGCAKSKLIGEHALLKNEKGAYQPLYDGGEMIGFVIRCKKDVRPVFISPGSFIDFEAALKIVLILCRGHKIPEPLRLVHMFVNKKKKEGGLNGKNKKNRLSLLWRT